MEVDVLESDQSIKIK